MAVVPFQVPRILQRGSPARQLQDGSLARLARYSELRDFYAGHHFPSSAGRSRATPTVFNYARAIVDKHVAYLFSRGIQFQGPAAGDAIAQAMAEIAEETALDLVLIQAATNASITGDAVLKAIWQGDRVRILNIDPARFFPTHAGDDPEQLRQVALVSTISAEEAATRFDYTTTKPRLEQIETWTDATLTITLDNAEVLSTVNPYGFIPFVHIANLSPPGTPWGRSDLEDIIDPNRELDRTISNQSETIRYHADPPVIFKGVREHSDLAVGPGTVWDIPAEADVRLLEWTGQTPAVGEHIERVLRAIFDVTESPRSSFGDTDQAFSGVALEAQLQPIVQRTLRKRIAWEPRLRQLAAMALRLRDQFTGSSLTPYRVKVLWEPMLPRDDAAEANIELALTAGSLKAPSTSMEHLGIPDPQAEIARILEERTKLGITTSATPAEQNVRLVPTASQGSTAG